MKLTYKTILLNSETSNTNDNVETQDPEKHQHEAHETQQWRDTLG